ncbi:MAG: hypothetical protein EOP42_10315 [Sphingobacteriaceae bacterium]|nr:MAG: hypothetical protein EOP42_10315 [Sphingobacteriaceae bacterium]
MNFKLTKGFNRNVVLLGKYAIKFPRNTLGLISNLNETIRWKHDHKSRHLRCPVLYGSSIMVIMKRCMPCSENIFENLSEDYKTIDDFNIHNFGILKEETGLGHTEKIVCLDYGNNLVYSKIEHENKYFN